VSAPLGISVRIATASGEASEGRCVGLEPVREQVFTSVEFDSSNAPLLRLGEETELEFRSEGLESGVHVRALTVLRSDDGDRRCYCFQARVSKRVLGHLMDRRRALRTRLGPSEAVKVTLLDVGEPAPVATLHDISATGFSLLVDAALEQQLVGRASLRAQFELPDAMDSIEVLARIRHRRLDGTKLLYGLEIEGRIPEFMRAQEGILLHLASLRQRAR